MEEKAMEVAGGVVDHKASFVQFVYPFLYAAGTFEERVGVVEQAQWQGWESRIWQVERVPVNLMLPHVANYLNPQKGTRATVRLWALEGGALQSIAAGLGSEAQWWLTLSRRQVPIQFEAVRLALF